jgi:hypothetical protein
MITGYRILLVESVGVDLINAKAGIKQTPKPRRT